eukprot:TRINITY_DN5458_c0_g1_i1.p1 TRINITY_DN5458_c0_g1~~TRINITY_DN5458_c0_g1_i1.p1  ORF type:complete len:670 (+),score=153.70 TRINITY_DN5458_c0_g1_i1:293-2011(+)
MAKMDPNVPHLINLSEDASLNGCLVYFLPPGQAVKLGSDPTCQIVLAGLGVRPFMCCLINTDNTSLLLKMLLPDGSPVTSESSKSPRSSVKDGPGRILLNGKPILVPERPLKHNERLLVGHSFCFRLNVPLQAALEDQKGTGQRRRKKRLKTDVQEALFEVFDPEADEFRDCQELIGTIQDRIGPEAAEDFIQSFGSLMPLVEEGNLITAEVRPQDKLRFLIEVSNSAETFLTDPPKLIVRLVKELPDGRSVVIDVVDADNFIERLDDIRDVYARFKSNPDSLDFSKCAEDPWASCNYEEVQQMILDIKTTFDEDTEKKDEEIYALQISQRTLLKELALAQENEKQAKQSALALQEELEAVKLQKSSDFERLAELEKTCSQLQGKLKDSEKAYDTLAKTHEDNATALKSKLETSQSKASDDAKLTAQLQQTCKSLQDELNGAKAAYDDLAKTKENLITVLRNEVEALQNKTSNDSKLAEQLEKQCSSLRNELDTAQKAKESSESSTEKLQEENIRLRVQLDSARSGTSCLPESVGSWKELEDELIRRKAALQKLKEKLHKDMTTLQSETQAV